MTPAHEGEGEIVYEEFRPEKPEEPEAPDPRPPAMTLDDIFEAVRQERLRQIEKWGDGQDLHPETYLRILIEEVGEIARAIQREDWQEVSKEIIQTMAVCGCWLQRG